MFFYIITAVLVALAFAVLFFNWLVHRNARHAMEQTIVKNLSWRRFAEIIDPGGTLGPDFLIYPAKGRPKKRHSLLRPDASYHIERQWEKKVLVRIMVFNGFLGPLFEGTFQGPEQHGAARLWCPDGELWFSGQVCKGVISGEVIVWDEDGEEMMKLQFADDKLIREDEKVSALGFHAALYDRSPFAEDDDDIEYGR